MLPPERPVAPVVRHITFTVVGDDYIQQIEKQIEWLKSRTPEEIRKQTKVKIHEENQSL